MPRKSVFISSTYVDLHEYRKAVWDLLATFDVDVRGMERFGARPSSPSETCLAEVEQSDVYIGIVAFRLGTIEPETKRSFTELEYERAVETKKDIRVYIAHKDTPFPASVIETGTRAVARLTAFKQRLSAQHTVVTFASVKDLVDKLRSDLEQMFETKELAPATDAASVFAQSTVILREFRLTPARYNGTQVRLSVTFNSGAYPASRDICRQFNLDYGATIGFHVRITQPGEKGLGDGLHELYATGYLMDTLREMRAAKDGELYATLRFATEDMKKTQGEFFGNSYYAGEEEPDDDMIYIPPEGKVIMLFTKPANPRKN
jgi:hypothetical protein